MTMATGDDKSIIKQIHDITECPICSERFTDPRSLPCVHSFCLKCIENYARDKLPGMKQPCPMCRKDFIIPDGGVSDLPKNFFIGKFMHIKPTVSVSDSCLAYVAAKLREIHASVEQQKQYFSKTVGKAEMEICEKAEEDKKLIERSKQKLLDELTTKQQCVVKRLGNLSHEIIQHLSLVDNMKKYLEELSAKGAGADIAREISVLHGIAKELLEVDAIEESRDEMDSTDVKFTASTALIEGSDNAIGKIEVIISAKVKKEKPTIKLKHDKVEDTEEENVRITSTITGEPEPNVEWFKDNVQLTPSSRITMEKSDNEHSLMINQVSQQDAGQYTVRATNSVGITEAVTSLTVKVLTPSLKHVISKGGGQVAGVTSLNNQLFVLRHSAQQQIEVYDTATFTSQKNISVPGLGNTYGLASCAVNNVLYVTEFNNSLVYRVSLQSGSNTVTQWSVGKHPFGISLNSVNNVLVTCRSEHKIQEYTTNGSLIRDISMSSAGINNPRYTIQLANGQLAINNGSEMYVVNNNGALIRKYTNTTGASIQLSSPRELALVQNGCALLANYGGHQIVFFNASFTSARALSLPSNSALQHPRSLSYDESRGRLFVGEWSSGRVLVFDNVFNVGSDFQ